MDVEGWTPAHDDCHYSNELVAAAACYSSHVVAREWVYQDRPENYREEPVPDDWPVNWDDEWWKPTNPRRDLVKAAALLLAEIERIDRPPPSVTIKEKGVNNDLLLGIESYIYCCSHLAL
jgi:hypothetical protein